VTDTTYSPSPYSGDVSNKVARPVHVRRGAKRPLLIKMAAEVVFMTRRIVARLLSSRAHSGRYRHAGRRLHGPAQGWARLLRLSEVVAGVESLTDRVTAPQNGCHSVHRPGCW
jgi:hypothetical protein